MKLIVVLLAVLFVFGMCEMAFGEATGPAMYKHAWLNKCLPHDHQYTLEKDRPELELGIIAEVIMYRDVLASIPYYVGMQSQYVWESGDWGLYGKIVVDLSPITNKLLGK